jgi:hypothetical protein
VDLPFTLSFGDMHIIAPYITGRNRCQITFRTTSSALKRRGDRNERINLHPMSTYQHSIRIWVLLHRGFETGREILFPIVHVNEFVNPSTKRTALQQLPLAPGVSPPPQPAIADCSAPDAQTQPLEDKNRPTSRKRKEPKAAPRQKETYKEPTARCSQ